MARKKSGSGGSGKFLLGLALGIVIAGAGTVAYFRYVAQPVPGAVVSKPLLLEKNTVPQGARAPIDHARKDYGVKKAPFGISEDVFEAGAHVYRRDCASCHGTPGHDGTTARSTNPPAVQLWKKHANDSGVGVSDVAPGETYWKIANGVPQRGMPTYQHVLSETQIWQVSLLLKNADQQLPDPVIRILNGSK